MVIHELDRTEEALAGSAHSTALTSSVFPCVHQTFWVYVAITEGRGRLSSRLRMTSLSTGETMFELPGEIDFGGPTNVGELTFQFNGVSFAQPGVYAVEFWAGGDLLGSRKITVHKLDPKPS